MLPNPPKIDHLTVSGSADGYRFVFSKEVSRKDFITLLNWLPYGFDINFYDQYYPSMSDPGAYVTVQRRDDIFIYMLGNHGWSIEWMKQSQELLAAWLMLSIEKKGGLYEPLLAVSVRKASSNPWLR